MGKTQTLSHSLQLLINDVNRSEEWLNSGLNTTGGWNPPFIQLRDVVMVEDASFYTAIGAWCISYDSSFREASITYSIPTIFIASIALSKSGCNPNAVGPNGQQGLMQLSRSQLPPGGSVSPHDNIMIGAKLLQDRLFVFNNNIIECIGMYGGWFRGMTEWDPCVKQRQVPQDLDFLQKFFNGLILGRNYEWMGTYQCEGLCSGARLC